MGGRTDDQTGEEGRDGYVCVACERSFASETALRRHVHAVGIVD